MSGQSSRPWKKCHVSMMMPVCARWRPSRASAVASPIQSSGVYGEYSIATPTPCVPYCSQMRMKRSRTPSSTGTVTRTSIHSLPSAIANGSISSASACVAPSLPLMFRPAMS